MPLSHATQLSQLRLRSITAGLEDFSTLQIALNRNLDCAHVVSIRRDFPDGKWRAVDVPLDHLLVLARLEPDSPLRVHHYETPPPPPEPPLTPLHVPKGNRGKTFDPAKDEPRTNATLDAVKSLMRDGQWRTLHQLRQSLYIQANIHSTEAGISARLRDLRKAEYGGHTVERERVPETNGLWRYRMVVR